MIRALRLAGHDVVSIGEAVRGTSDLRIISRAYREGRILITEDTDFGELVYAHARPSAGVVLIRFHSRVRRAKPKAVVEAIDKFRDRLRGGFAVVEPGRVRLGRRPRIEN